MSLILLEGFEVRQSTADLVAGPWVTASCWTFSSGRVGGSAAYSITNFTTDVFSSSTTAVLGVAVKGINNGASVYDLSFNFLSAGVVQDHFYLSASTGSIQGVAGSTTVISLPANAQYENANNVWNYFEFKVKCGASGYMEVRINGVSVATFSGNTLYSGNGLLDQISIGAGGGANGYALDDIYVLSGNGTINNDFLGDTVVYGLNPTGNGTVNTWVGDDGNSVNNYQQLSTTRPPGTTHYVESNVLNAEDRYVFGGLSTSGTVAGVQVSSYATKSDSGLRSVANVVNSAGVETQGIDHVLALGTKRWYVDLVETDPATSALWTSSAVNAAEFGVKVR